MIRRGFLVSLVCIAAAAPSPLSAQDVVPSAYAQAQATVSRALALQRAGSFQDAHALLENALVQCGFTMACRNLVHFSIGFLFHAEARSAADPEPLLNRAIQAYEQVAGVPDAVGPGANLEADAIYNRALVYRALGPHEWQESGYRNAPVRDAARSGLHYTFLGDYFAGTNRWLEAADAYRRALREDQDSDAPLQGLLDVYERSGALPAAELHAAAEAAEASHPGISARAYAAIVQRERTADPLAAEQALIRYVRVVSGGEGMNSIALSRLPADWRPVRELAAYVAEADAAAPWWRELQTRARALSSAALGAGERTLAAGDAARAERYFAAGLRLVEPGSREALDLSRELALLYFAHDSLDVDGRSIERLDHARRFAATPEALEAAQRYHSILGLIHAERGVWRSAVPGRNAIDQLTWAIEAAARRDAAERFHQPLPDLRTRLAQGYQAMGETRAAFEQLSAAVAGYLDADDLDAATRADAEATRIGGSSSLAPLVAFRTRLRDASDSDAPEAATLCGAERIAAALQGASGAGAEFVSRQRFKLLSDCLDTGPPERRAAYGAEALLLVADSAVPLVGMADVMRVENAAAAVRARALISDFDAHIDRTPHDDGVVLHAVVPSITGPAYVAVPHDAMVAAHVIQLIGARSELYWFTVQDGVVTFDQRQVLTADLSRAISSLRGVTSVRTRARQF